MTEDQCDECGAAGWIVDTFEVAGEVLIPCPLCIDAGRAIPPKPVREIDEELDEVDDYIGWEEV